MRSLPSPAYIAAVNPAQSAFSISTGRPVTRWELAISSPSGSCRKLISHEDLHGVYTDKTKSQAVFLATAHRDISRLVFYDRRVVVRMAVKQHKTNTTAATIIDEDKRLTGKWKLGIDLEQIYQHEHAKTIMTANSNGWKLNPLVLVKYYFNGTYHEKEVEARYLKEFVGYRDVIYGQFEMPQTRDKK